MITEFEDLAQILKEIKKKMWGWVFSWQRGLPDTCVTPPPPPDMFTWCNCQLLWLGEPERQRAGYVEL